VEKAVTELNNLNKTELAALDLLLEKGGYSTKGIVEELIKFRLLKSDDLERVKLAYRPIEDLYILLKKLQSSERVSFLEFSWTKLPRESVELRIVHELDITVFSFSD
jgi:hypothetical protein